MRRKFSEVLSSWKNKEVHLPLLVQGARQIGKTYSLKQFGQDCFVKTIYINFETDRYLAGYLEQTLDPKKIIDAIAEIYHQQIVPEETLIIFDEIQACDRALTALKYFAEQAPEYYVAAAGSLLGVALKHKNFSFPVGKVEWVRMYPMDFEEFLWAKGEEFLAGEIRSGFMNNRPLSSQLHEQALLYYREYLLVGGMPAAVADFVEHRDFRQHQNLLYDAYVADMTKYMSAGDLLKVTGVYTSLLAQLAKDNRKFQYKLLKSGARASVYADAVEWLVNAGVVLKCSLVEKWQYPLNAYVDGDSFKLYYSDVGLLAFRADLRFDNLDLAKQFMGAVTENYVAQVLMGKGYSLQYWQSKNTAEVDFLLEKDGRVIPLEVKADMHTRSRSLSVYVKEYHPDYAIRVSAKNFGMENNIQSVPLYAVHCL